VSLNEGALITDRAGFEAYAWPDPDTADYDQLDAAEPPEGMKYIVWGPGGVLENMIGIVGFDRLCLMTVDDPDLLEDVSAAVGERLARYYELSARSHNVGALMVNDDWGFKTQTMLDPPNMRKYVIAWHAEIVRRIHATGKPAILHSCGNLEAVMDDIIDVCGYDAKHSWEDAIVSVEDAYEQYGERIAIMGGIDVDFLCRQEPALIYLRSRSMLERSGGRGGYALGSGNSLPDYVPTENALAMRRAALDMR
jgi:uroporphyrinogen decarboxylase